MIPEIDRTDKQLLFVFKGMVSSDLRELNHKLYTIKADVTLQELNEKKGVLLKETVLKSGDKSPYYWCTYEEYITAQDSISNFYYTVCIDNNLYHTLYPYPETITNIFKVYEEIYYKEDTELNDDQQQIIATISKYYGKIYKNSLSDHYYITYEMPEFAFDETIEYYSTTKLTKVELIDESSIDIPKEGVNRLELGDNEDELLLFIEKITKGVISPFNIFYIVGDRSNLPNNYDERLAILNNWILDDEKVYFSTKQLNSRVIEREDEYIQLLDKYWKYPCFKKLKMYKDIEQHGNVTVEVSQSQIINDIVEQSEDAFLNESFRDIYVTSSTGSGKSIMFQIPALYLAEKFKNDGFLTIVISPLIGLMDDQVQSMERKNIKTAKTIHSNISQNERDTIIEGVQNGTVDILYISTETLQSHSDLSILIGQRKLGLLVVDEAHIVTTWGKSFRADYWYMGTYLSKLRKKQAFPIVTFTATAIFGGQEDMYLETRDSLNMLNPISYFGYVRRDDIDMHITPSQEQHEKYGKEYLKTKFEIICQRLEKFEKRKEKTLVYFPTVKNLNRFNSHLKLNYPALSEKTARYYGSLDKEEKKQTYKAFLKGETTIMLATKAFGMGIDIPDITNVYHYAATGNVIDYVQEIGRSARDLDKGRAWFDFLNKDFTDVKRLHGMSTIKKQELIETLRKIHSLFEQSQSRNIIVNAEEFKYIFNQKDTENFDIENKIKITLLMLEKDFEKKLGYSPFVARPRQLFGTELVLLNKEGYRRLSQNVLNKYFKEVYSITDNDTFHSVCTLDYKSLWKDRYPQLSFPQFKWKVNQEVDTLKDFKVLSEISPALQVKVDYLKSDINTIMSQINVVLDSFEEFLRRKLAKREYFREEEVGMYLYNALKLNDRFHALSIGSVLVNALLQVKKIKGINYISDYQSESELYKITPNYLDFFHLIKATMKKLYNKDRFAERTQNTLTYYSLRNHNSQNLEMEKVLLGIAEIIGVSNYEIKGGDDPQIYIRINSGYQIENVIKSPQRYQNRLLADVHNRHRISVELLTYLFKLEKKGNTNREKIKNYTDEFWEIIEQYFLGKLPDKVIDKLNKAQ